MAAVRVATLNLRKGELRWDERAQLLMEQLAALRPDIIGFQEVDLRIDQGNWICGRLNVLLGTGAGMPEYRIHHMANPRENVSLEALGIMTRLPVIAHTGFDYLIRNRVAHCLRIDVGGQPLDFWNTHFHYLQDKPGNEMRCEQADKLTAWIGAHSQGVPVIAVGDFNCIPESRPLRMIATRLTSVFDRLGFDAPPTAPTPLEVPPRYPGLWPVDHIFASDGVRVLEGSRVFDQPDAKDAALYPSDHFGLAATIDRGGAA